MHINIVPREVAAADEELMIGSYGAESQFTPGLVASFRIQMLLNHSGKVNSTHDILYIEWNEPSFSFSINI